MQEVEKVNVGPTENSLISESGKVLCTELISKVASALILFVPFWIESVHDLLKRII